LVIHAGHVGGQDVFASLRHGASTALALVTAPNKA